MNLKAYIKKMVPIRLLHVRRMYVINRNKRIPLNEYEKYLCKWYKKRTGYELDMERLETFTQRQQWLKLYDQDELKTMLCDKYAVRQYVSDIVGDKYLVPLIMIDGRDHFYNANEIEFDKLPNEFVLKCNHGSQTNIIVKDKNSLSNRDIKKIKTRLNYWLQENYAFLEGLELQYKDVKPCIIIEKYMSINDDLPDYKFLCFSGEVKFVWCDQGRYAKHRRTLFDVEYNVENFSFNNYESISDVKKPENYDQMVNIASQLCGKYPYVRVDLYNLEGNIYFSELTFSSGSGVEMPYPIEYDRILAPLISIEKSKRDNSKVYKIREKC